jgi:hypothetical protein
MSAALLMAGAPLVAGGHGKRAIGRLRCAPRTQAHPWELGG